MSFWAALWTVIGPQAIRVLIPPTIGVYVAVLKDLSFASIVGLVELTRAGLLVRETVGDSLTVFLLLAGIYFVINLPIERRAGTGEPLPFRPLARNPAVAEHL